MWWRVDKVWLGLAVTELAGLGAGGEGEGGGQAQRGAPPGQGAEAEGGVREAVPLGRRAAPHRGTSLSTAVLFLSSAHQDSSLTQTCLTSDQMLA